MSHLLSLLLFCGCTAAGVGRYLLLRRREQLLKQGVWVLSRWRVLLSSQNLSTRRLFTALAQDSQCRGLTFLSSLEQGFSAENPNNFWVEQLHSFCRDTGQDRQCWAGMELALSRLGASSAEQQLDLLDKAGAIQQQAHTQAKALLAEQGKLSGTLGVLLGAGLGVFFW